MALISKWHFNIAGRNPADIAWMFVWFVGVVIIFSKVDGCQKACNRTAEELVTWIKKGYDGSSRPNKTGGPVIIEVDSYVSSVSSINEKNMDFSLDMYFRRRWKDPRLSYQPFPHKPPDQRLVLNAEFIKYIWQPNIYFRNSKEAHYHSVPTQNTLFGISPDGSILLSTRITSVLDCQMDFRHFPMDQQICHFQVGSWRLYNDDDGCNYIARKHQLYVLHHAFWHIFFAVLYTTRQMFQWRARFLNPVPRSLVEDLSSNSETEDNVIVKWRNENGIFIPSDVEIPQYDLSQVKAKNNRGVYTTGVFSEPDATFIFKRRLMFYVYGFYLPVTLVVLLSWVSFWIDPESTPARVSLGVITILAMGNFLHGGGATPSVSYATALDVYIITCFVFVFASLLEYAAVHCAINKYQDVTMNEPCSLVKFSEPMKSEGSPESAENESVSSNSTARLPMSLHNNEERSMLRRKSFAQEAKMYYFHFNSTSLDRYSRVAFPALFLIFNVAYWLTYHGPSVNNHGVW